MGAIFLSMGVWPVTLFLLLPVSGLILAYRELERHAGDFERLTLDRDRLVLESHSPDADRRMEFNSQWVQVILRADAAGGTLLALRSHGREFAFGYLLSDEERATLGHELKLRLARIRH